MNAKKQRRAYECGQWLMRTLFLTLVPELERSSKTTYARYEQTTITTITVVLCTAITIVTRGLFVLYGLNVLSWKTSTLFTHIVTASTTRFNFNN